MCYSANASLISFFISFTGFVYLFQRNMKNDRFIGFIILGISTMQLGEYLIHIDIDCKNNLNKIGSRIGFLSHIIIQPLFALISLLLFSGKKFDFSLLVVWFFIWMSHLVYSSIHWPENWCSYKYECQNKENQCQLYWPWFSSINPLFYALLVFILPIICADMKTGIKAFWLLYCFIGPIISTKVYPKTAASIWCFIGPMITVGIQIFNLPSKITQIL
tara:strand:- start:586 stop:1239 length:654 start_codon:yes stop_codon:yes gene_type:complete